MSTLNESFTSLLKISSAFCIGYTIYSIYFNNPIVIVDESDKPIVIVDESDKPIVIVDESDKPIDYETKVNMVFNTLKCISLKVPEFLDEEYCETSDICSEDEYYYDEPDDDSDDEHFWNIK